MKQLLISIFLVCAFAASRAGADDLPPAPAGSPASVERGPIVAAQQLSQLQSQALRTALVFATRLSRANPVDARDIVYMTTLVRSVRQADLLQNNKVDAEAFSGYLRCVEAVILALPAVPGAGGPDGKGDVFTVEVRKKLAEHVGIIRETTKPLNAEPELAASLDLLAKSLRGDAGAIPPIAEPAAPLLKGAKAAVETFAKAASDPSSSKDDLQKLLDNAVTALDKVKDMAAPDQVQVTLQLVRLLADTAQKANIDLTKVKRAVAVIRDICSVAMAIEPFMPPHVAAVKASVLAVLGPMLKFFDLGIDLFGGKKNGDAGDGDGAGKARNAKADEAAKQVEEAAAAAGVPQPVSPTAGTPGQVDAPQVAPVDDETARRMLNQSEQKHADAVAAVYEKSLRDLSEKVKSTEAQLANPSTTESERKRLTRLRGMFKAARATLEQRAMNEPAISRTALTINPDATVRAQPVERGRRPE